MFENNSVWVALNQRNWLSILKELSRYWKLLSIQYFIWNQDKQDSSHAYMDKYAVGYFISFQLNFNISPICTIKVQTVHGPWTNCWNILPKCLQTNRFYVFNSTFWIRMKQIYQYKPRRVKLNLLHFCSTLQGL